jgi:hypothetical protein
MVSAMGPHVLDPLQPEMHVNNIYPVPTSRNQRLSVTKMKTILLFREIISDVMTIT